MLHSCYLFINTHIDSNIHNSYEMPVFESPVIVKKLSPNVLQSQCAVMRLVFNRAVLKQSKVVHDYLSFENQFDYKDCGYNLNRSLIQWFHMNDNCYTFTIAFHNKTSYLVISAPTDYVEKINFIRTANVLKHFRLRKSISTCGNYYVDYVDVITDIKLVEESDIVRLDEQISNDVRIISQGLNSECFWTALRHVPFNIVDLQLSNSNIVKFGHEFKNFTSLLFLNLSANRIRKWNWLTKYGLKLQLHSLTIRGNALRKFPLQILCLKRLHLLDIQENPIKYLPRYVHFLKSLHRFDIRSTNISYLPVTINQLSLLSFGHDPLNGLEIVSNDHSDKILDKLHRIFDVTSPYDFDTLFENEQKYFVICCCCGRKILCHVFSAIFVDQQSIFDCNRLVSIERYFCSKRCSSRLISTNSNIF